MPADQRQEQRAAREGPDGPAPSAAISGHVLSGLGMPDDLVRVQVRHVWAGHYRVNVLTGTDAASARVAHSYFVLADEDGNVLDSAPAIRRRY